MKPNSSPLWCALVSTTVTSNLLWVDAAYALDYFEPNAIENRNGTSRNIDLSALSTPGALPPGDYRTDVYINSQLSQTRAITFTTVKGKLMPVIKKSDLIGWGVQRNATRSFAELSDNAVIPDISNYIPSASMVFLFEEQTLKFSIPQNFMTSQARGYVDPAEWNDGINMAYLNYAYSGSQAHFSGNNGTTETNYLNLRGGVNLGPWRFRNYSTWNDSDSDPGWNAISTYAQRDIKSLKSQLIIGDSYTSGDIFDSFSYRGAQIISDDSMQPESLRGYAPVIRGIAQSNAQVTVRQNGNIIWQSWVPPGPFVVSDLYPTSTSGDLQVTIQEADGTLRQFSQPFSAVPLMQREGRLKYAFTVGKYREPGDNVTSRKPEFAQATAMYGLPWTTTLFSGAIISGDYHAFNAGVGKGLGYFGALSADVTHARTSFDDGTKQGNQFRIQYAKSIEETNTTLSLAAYRYSSSGFYQFSEANGYYTGRYPPGYTPGNDDSENQAVRDAWAEWLSGHSKKNKIQLNLSQSLGDAGSFFVTGYQQSYWGISGTEKNLGAGYNIGIDGITYSVNYSYSRSPFYDQTNNVFSLSVQIPLDRFLPKSWATLSTTGGNNTDTTSWAGITGNAFEDNRLTYSVQQGYSNGSTGTTGTAYVNYKAPVAELQGGYNYSGNGHQYNYGLAGGVVAHPYGVTFSQSLGETMALVRATSANDVKVLNQSGVRTNSAGMAIIPYVTPYQRNQIMLDTSNTGRNVDILRDTEFVVPTKGALALAQFETVSGYRVMLTLTNTSIPFGATATLRNEMKTLSGIVDDRQRVFFSGAPAKGVVEIKWNSGYCSAPYTLSGADADIYNLSVNCH